mmetsp:Transcript_43434/g.88858  ORF Transcript_43434/g.88858 Transcript_43434/m.88858 type:complete len:736 (+) Transcript_43434:176-2383(+)
MTTMVQTMVQTDMQVDSGWGNCNASVTTRPARTAQIKAEPIVRTTTVVHKVNVGATTRKLRSKLNETRAQLRQAIVERKAMQEELGCDQAAEEEFLKATKILRNAQMIKVYDSVYCDDANGFKDEAIDLARQRKEYCRLVNKIALNEQRTEQERVKAQRAKDAAMREKHEHAAITKQLKAAARAITERKLNQIRTKFRREKMHLLAKVEGSGKGPGMDWEKGRVELTSPVKTTADSSFTTPVKTPAPGAASDSSVTTPAPVRLMVFSAEIQQEIQRRAEAMATSMTAKVIAEREARWQLKVGHSYTYAARLLCYDLIPCVSGKQLPFVIRRFMRFAGVSDKHVPCPNTLRNLCLEMRAISHYCTGVDSVHAAKRSLSWDGTKKGQQKHQSVLMGMSPETLGEKPRIDFIAHIPMASGSAQHGAKAVVDALDDVVHACAAAGNEDVAEMINIGFINEGCITDHAQGEVATADALEEMRHLYFELNMPGYAEKTREEQCDISGFKRHYCLDHKIDNLGKEGVTAFKEWAIEDGFVKKNLMGGLCTRKNWVWCAHKLLGIPSAKTTDTNLGPLVGDRFWANYFNAACLYAIHEDIHEFLSVDNMHLLAAKQKVENNHVQTVRMFCCNMYPKGEERDRNMARVMCEVRAMGLIHIVVMVPALMVTHVHIKDVNDQTGQVRNMQQYFTQVMDPDNDEYAQSMMTYSETPVTFLTGTAIPPDRLTEVQRLLFASLCSTRTT